MAVGGEGESYVSNDLELNEKLLAQATQEAEKDRFVRLSKICNSEGTELKEEIDSKLDEFDSDSKEKPENGKSNSIFEGGFFQQQSQNVKMGSNDDEGSLENGEIVRSSRQNPLEEF